VVLNLLLIGLAVTLDPLPLTAFLVVLPSARGVRKSAAYVFGWLVSLAIVVTVTVVATGNNPPKPATVPSLAALAAKIALGVVLVVIGVRHIRARGQPKPPKKPPKWQEHVDSMSPWFAMGLAPTLQPWVLIGAGAATVVEAKLSSWQTYLALFGSVSWPQRPTWPWRSTPLPGPPRPRCCWPGSGPGSSPTPARQSSQEA
jgi:hypothetical protein